jgi:lipopolysaccharide/colanic/teichoic acid biosynthesis glycosyltransferase
MGKRVGDCVIDEELKIEFIEIEKKQKNTFAKKLYNPVFKRVADISCSIVALAILVILIPFVAVAIKLDSKGPIFFKQLRVGQHGVLFRMYKFRTMCHNAEGMIDQSTFDQKNNPFIQSENDKRVTKVGKFLRQFSIDELPQLFCVLKGDMSFIGPRAWIPNEIKKLNRDQLYRLVVKPGLTGYAQIKGRNNLPLDQRIEKDLYYIEHMSAALDIKILFLSIFAVIKQDGAF